MAGWLLFAGSLVPIVWRGGGPSARRDPASIPAMLLQGAGFALAWESPRRVDALAPAAGMMLSWAWAVSACALAVGCGLFAVTAVRHLGKQWSLVARVADEHDLITSGPYAIVRHPIYTAMLGLLVATGMTFSSVPATLLGVVLYLLGTLIRTRIEERLLMATFGERYQAYARRVPALIPFSRPRR